MIPQATVERPALLAENAKYRVYAVRWTVLEGVDGEGLLFEPRGAVLAQVVALPDADQTPEAAPFAVRLAESGCRVLAPVLIDRKDTWSGNPKIKSTNQPHREWIYRMAYEMGRHPAGYEVEKVMAAVDWFSRSKPDLPVGVAGYGEGGLVAFYAAALDKRIRASLVSGYFAPREGMWQQPIYRNVWGLLREFGDAEIAGLIAPRALVIEAARHPEVSGPPPQREGGAARRGRDETPDISAVRRRVRTRRACAQVMGGSIELIENRNRAPKRPCGVFAQLGVMNWGRPVSAGIQTPAGYARSDAPAGRPTVSKRRSCAAVGTTEGRILEKADASSMRAGSRLRRTPPLTMEEVIARFDRRTIRDDRRISTMLPTRYEIVLPGGRTCSRTAFYWYERCEAREKGPVGCATRVGGRQGISLAPKNEATGTHLCEVRRCAGKRVRVYARRIRISSIASARRSAGRTH
jgi:hypothetical protein